MTVHLRFFLLVFFCAFEAITLRAGNPIQFQNQTSHPLFIQTYAKNAADKGAKKTLWPHETMTLSDVQDSLETITEVMPMAGDKSPLKIRLTQTEDKDKETDKPPTDASLSSIEISFPPEAKRSIVDLEKDTEIHKVSFWNRLFQVKFDQHNVIRLVEDKALTRSRREKKCMDLVLKNPKNQKLAQVLQNLLDRSQKRRDPNIEGFFVHVPGQDPYGAATQLVRMSFENFMNDVSTTVLVDKGCKMTKEIYRNNTDNIRKILTNVAQLGQSLNKCPGEFSTEIFYIDDQNPETPQIKKVLLENIALAKYEGLPDKLSQEEQLFHQVKKLETEISDWLTSNHEGQDLSGIKKQFQIYQASIQRLEKDRETLSHQTCQQRYDALQTLPTTALYEQLQAFKASLKEVS